MIADGVKVDCIVTSPPYWGLRSYLPADHPHKHREIGSEPTLQQFLATMVEVFELARQVLADDGTLWVNMGDSYAGSWGSQGREYSGVGVSALSARQVAASQRKATQAGKIRDDGVKPKDLMGQPWRLAFALQDAGWWLRQDIIWHKPNPMPESIKDRCTKAHEYLFLLSKSERYYFDQGAIRTPLRPETKAKSFDTMDFKARDKYSGTGVGWGYASDDPKPRTKHNSFARETKDSAGEHGQKPQHRPDRDEVHYTNSANKRSVWTVATEAYPGSHYATYPRALVEPCVLAGSRPGGVVLDIFGGSGTTAQVAQTLGRNWILFDIDERNQALQRDRLRQPALQLGDCEALTSVLSEVGS
jgi:DNA modification methylase